MIALTLVGTAGALLHDPILGIVVYYFLTVLRPQSLWAWTLPPGVRWSLFVAVATLIAITMKRMESGRGKPGIPKGDAPPILPGLTIGPKLMIAFVVWQYVSYLGAKDPSMSEKLLADYRPTLIMFVASSLYISRLRQVKSLFLVTAISLGYLAVDVNHKYFAWGRVDMYHEGYGGLDNNGAGLMLAMGIPLCYFCWEFVKRRFRWVFPIFAILLIHGVLMTYSRGAMVSTLAALPLIAWRSRKKRDVLIATAALVIVVPALAGEEIRDRFFTVEKYEEDGSAQARFESWESASKIALDYPVMGVGPRNSTALMPSYGSLDTGRVVHSLYLQLAADSGFVGVGLYLAMVIRFLIATRNTRRICRGRDDEPARLARSLAAGLEASMVLFLVGAVFLSLEAFELPFLVMLMGFQLEWIMRQRAKEAVDGVSDAAETTPESAVAAAPVTRG
jgi:probable O-glycosylation ligase (exosortase A-associated)